MPVFPLEVKKKDREGRDVWFVFDLARPSDEDDIVQFFLTHYFTATPIRETTFFDEFGGSKIPKWRLDMIRDYCTSPRACVIVVREKSTRCLVAYLETKLKNRQEMSMPTVNPNDRTHSARIWRVLDEELFRDVDLFTMYNTDTILMIGTGVVHPNCGQMGILVDIYEFQKEFALEHGGGAATVIASSFYIFKTVVKLDFQILRSIEYASFEMPDGTRPFAEFNLGVHRAISLGSQKLTSKEERKDNNIKGNNTMTTSPASKL